MKHTNEVVEFPSTYKYSQYYWLHYNEKTSVFLLLEDWTDIELENVLSGYFFIIMLESMNVKEVINLYTWSE